MATLSLEWWKKNKAKTLLKDPLSPALAECDKNFKQATATPVRENFALLSGSLKTAMRAIEQTKANCNKTLHASTLKSLDELNAIAAKRQKFCDDALIQHATFLATYQKTRNVTMAAVGNLLKTPTIANAQTAVKLIDGLIKIANDYTGTKSGEIGFIIKYGSLMITALKDVIKQLDLQAKKDPEFKPTQLAGLMNEIGSIEKKLNTAGLALPMDGSTLIKY